MAGFTKAEKRKAKARIAMYGISGSGKSYSALRVATGMAREISRIEKRDAKIAAIDSERGSISKYADRFSFDAVDLEHKTIDEYVAYINEAQRRGYDVLIIDSGSHAWQELLEEIDKLAQAKYRGNTWGAWSEGTPKQKRLVNAILGFKGHIIFTMRAKTEWTIVDDKNGKKAPSRQGLAPEQGKGIEYEFDMLMEISEDHLCRVVKDRTGKFQDKIIDKPGEDFGAEIISWLNEGAPAIDKSPAPEAAAAAAPAAKVAIDYNINPIKGSGKEGRPWAEHKPVELAKAVAYFATKKNGAPYIKAITTFLTAAGHASAPANSTTTAPEAAAAAAPAAKIESDPVPGDEAIGPAFSGKVTEATAADVQTIAEGEDPFSKVDDEEKAFFGKE